MSTTNLRSTAPKSKEAIENAKLATWAADHLKELYTKKTQTGGGGERLEQYLKYLSIEN
jgi:hypothetical protein